VTKSIYGFARRISRDTSPGDVMARRESESDFVTVAVLLRTTGFSAGELTSAMADGSLPPPSLRADGMPYWRRADIEALYA
jgi:hypothetical protein